LNRRDFLKLATLGAVVATVPNLARAAGVAKPNVILCMSDDQGWGDVSYNEQGRLAGGKFKTPELDKMAANGLRFDRFYAAGPRDVHLARMLVRTRRMRRDVTRFTVEQSFMTGHWRNCS
jgi:hypothetical protein